MSQETVVLLLFQYLYALPQQRHHRGKDGHGDAEGADGVGDVDAVELYQDGGDDDADAAERVSQDVQKDACKLGQSVARFE